MNAKEEISRTLGGLVISNYELSAQAQALEREVQQLLGLLESICDSAPSVAERIKSDAVYKRRISIEPSHANT